MTTKTVLVVDDVAPIREMLTAALHMAGYQCLEADNAQTAHGLIVDHHGHCLAGLDGAGGQRYCTGPSFKARAQRCRHPHYYVHCAGQSRQ